MVSQVSDKKSVMSEIIPTLLLTLVFSILFSVFPEIDLIISRLFYDPQNGFFLRRNPVIVLLYESIEVFVPVVIFFCVVGMIAVRIRKKKIFGLGYAGMMYLLITLAMGPGLLINGILKEFWGRARPATVEEFGGKLIFTPVLVPSKQCQSNCSFASGHASAGFFPLAFAFAIPWHKRKFLVIGITYGLLAGFARIAQGGHFFSDVIFAGLLVYLVSSLLWPFFDNKPEETLVEAKL